MPKDVPRLVELSRMFAVLEQLALDCDAQEAMRGLTIAKQSFIRIQREREPCRSRQAVIADYFPRKSN